MPFNSPIPQSITTKEKDLSAYSDGRLMTMIATACQDLTYNDTLGFLRFGYPCAVYGISMLTKADKPQLTAAELRTRDHALFSTLVFDVGDSLPKRAAWLTFETDAYRSLLIPSVKDTAHLSGPTQIDRYRGYYGLSQDDPRPLCADMLCTSTYSTDIIVHLLDEQEYILKTCTLPNVTLHRADTTHLDLSALSLPTATITTDTTFTDTLYHHL